MSQVITAEQDKKEPDSWKPAGKATPQAIEDAYDEYVKYLGKKKDTAALKALELQFKGGPCHYCGVPFKRVPVVNRHASFVMYEPDCRCYKRCDQLIHEATVDVKGNPVPEQRCGSWMVEERFKNLTRCLLCFREYRDGRKEVSAPARKGRRFSEQRDPTGDRD